MVQGELSHSYRIRNYNSGRYLDVPDGSTHDGVRLQQYQFNDGPPQQWEIIFNWAEEANNTAGGRLFQHPDWHGPFLIVSVASSRALDTVSIDDNSPVIQIRVHGGPRQRWYFEGPLNPRQTDAPPRYVIINASSLSALDVLDAQIREPRSDRAISHEQHTKRAADAALDDPRYVILNAFTLNALFPDAGGLADHELIVHNDDDNRPSQKWWVEDTITRRAVRLPHCDVFPTTLPPA
jgi:hypothetical protein